MPTEMSYHPAPMIQKWLWTEYIKMTQFILNRKVKRKQLCNEIFSIFKDQITGLPVKTVIKPMRTKSLEKYHRKGFECTSSVKKKTSGITKQGEGISRAGLLTNLNE